MDASIAAELPKIFETILTSYPTAARAEDAEPFKGMDKEKSTEIAKTFTLLIEQFLKLPDSSDSESLAAAVNEVIPAAEAAQKDVLTKIWLKNRDKVVLEVLSKKGGMLEDESRYKGIGWEFRMVTSGRGIQGISQPIAMLQINSKNVIAFRSAIRNNIVIALNITIGKTRN